MPSLQSWSSFVLAQAGPRLQSAMDWLANCVSRCSKSFSPHGEAGSHCGELAQSVCSASDSVAQGPIQTLVGRLVWYVHGAYWLKPWMQIWFFALHKPKLRFQMLSAEQIAELAEVLDNNGRVLRRCHLSDVQPGWKVLEVGNRCVTSSADVLGIPLKQRSTWSSQLGLRSWPQPMHLQKTPVAGDLQKAIAQLCLLACQSSLCFLYLAQVVGLCCLVLAGTRSIPPLGLPFKQRKKKRVAARIVKGSVKNRYNTGHSYAILPYRPDICMKLGGLRLGGLGNKPPLSLSH